MLEKGPPVPRYLMRAFSMERHIFLRISACGHGTANAQQVQMRLPERRSAWHAHPDSAVRDTFRRVMCTRPTPYAVAPLGELPAPGGAVKVFVPPGKSDAALVRSFGEEWVKFNAFTDEELDRVGGELFDLWPGGPAGRVEAMVDIGCGSGRWTRYLRNRAGHVDALDPSEAILKAATVHADLPHVRWTQARAEALPFADHTFDMALCIGVLHHLQEPVLALREAQRVVKPGGQLYFYMYYALEQRGRLYRSLFRVSDLVRRAVHRLPGRLKRTVCELIAIGVYLPLVSLARGMKAVGIRLWERMPLAYYHDKTYRIMRNDALDRFGTAREQRFTRTQIITLLHEAGFRNVRFSEGPPYWHGIAQRP
jgi:SAM-dependent methyltransferase